MRARESNTSWVSVLLGSRAIICRLDDPCTVSVLQFSVPISESARDLTNLPQIIRALAFDRNLHPARDKQTVCTDSGAEHVSKRRKIDPDCVAPEPGRPSLARSQKVRHRDGMR